MPHAHSGWQRCAGRLRPGYMRITALLLSFMLAVMRPAVQPLLHVAMLGVSLFASFPDLWTFCSPRRNSLSFRSHLQVCKNSLAEQFHLPMGAKSPYQVCKDSIKSLNYGPVEMFVGNRLLCIPFDKL